MKIEFQKLLMCLGLIVISFSISGQNSSNPDIPDPAILIGIHLGYQMPGFDMADRYGVSSQVGGDVQYLFKNSNVAVGLSGQYYFGSTVHDVILSNILDSGGHIIGLDGSYADYNIKQRGFLLGLSGSIVLPIGNLPRGSGLKVGIGASYFTHWIRLQDNLNNIGQFTEEYIKGYDRLCGGLAFSQFIGFQYLSKNRRINFYAGIEFVEGFTENLRAFDYSLFENLEETRFDLLSGLKVGWILPLYIEVQPDEIYY